MPMTPEEAQTLCKELQIKFGEPITSSEGLVKRLEYANDKSKPPPVIACVGGMVCRHVYGFPYNFPGTYTIGAALIKINPALTASEAFTYADDIVFANDSGDYAKAWSILEEVLTKSKSVVEETEP